MLGHWLLDTATRQMPQAKPLSQLAQSNAGGGEVGGGEGGGGEGGHIGARVMVKSVLPLLQTTSPMEPLGPCSGHTIGL